MEYIVKVDDNEYGPVTEQVLEEWVEDGRVLHDTPVRNSMMRAWRSAGELSFLKAAFEKQRKNFDIAASAPVSHPADLTHDLKAKHVASAEREKEQRESTDFKNSLLPERAGISLRLKAGMIDLIIVISILFFSFFAGAYCISKHWLNPDSAAYISFALCVFFFLLYFGGCIGVFAQTLGMWFYGIMLVRDGDDAEEVYLLRAYIYAFLILIIGVFSPIFNFIGGKKRSLHDFLTDTQVVKISARKT